MRPSSMRLNALNIVIHRTELQKPSSYVSLFKDLSELKQPLMVRSEQVLMVGPDWYESNDKSFLLGTIHRYVDIDKMAWYNTAEHRAANAAEQKEIRVPRNMAANYREIDCALHANSHTMVFIAKDKRNSISPLQVHHFFERLVKEPAITEKYGAISVSIEQDPAGLDEILSQPRLRLLRVTINRPNESLRRLEEQIQRQLKEMGARSQMTELHADEEDRLKPNEPVKDLAKAALSNGKVEAKAVINNRVEDLSTSQQLLHETVVYKEATEGRFQAFLRGARALLSRLATRHEQ